MYAPLNILLTPSFLLACYWWAIHAIAIIAIVLLTITSSIAVIWIILMASFLLAHGYVGWQFYPSIQQQYQGVSLHFDAEEWFLMRSGQREGLALKATTVWPWVIVLNFYALTSGKSQALLVFSDSCSADDYRHLKIHLKSAKSFT